MEYWFIGVCIVCAGWLFYVGSKIVSVALSGVKETLKEESRLAEMGTERVERMLAGYIKQLEEMRKEKVE